MVELAVNTSKITTRTEHKKSNSAREIEEMGKKGMWLLARVTTLDSPQEPPPASRCLADPPANTQTHTFCR